MGNPKNKWISRSTKVKKIENLKGKLWIHQFLNAFDIQYKSKASSLIRRIYRCDLTSLGLGHQTLSFGEFRKFTSSGFIEEYFFYKIIVKNDDGTIVPVEKLIELSPKLQKFDYINIPTEDGRQTITSETAANLIAIPHFPKLEKFYIYGMLQSFDIEAFFAIPKVRFSIFNKLPD